MEAEGPESSKSSVLRLWLNLNPSADPTQMNVSVVFAGPLVSQVKTCLLGQLDTVTFNDLGDQERPIVLDGIRAINADAADMSSVELSDYVIDDEFRRLTLSKEFSGGEFQRTLQIECPLETGAIWTRQLDTFWDTEIPRVGLSLKSDGVDLAMKVNSVLQVNRSDHAYYLEGYPAPAARSQSEDVFRDSSNGWGSSNGSASASSDSIIARYSDTAAESERGWVVFTAGVLAGFFASLIAAGFMRLFDEPAIDVVNASATPVQSEIAAESSGSIESSGPGASPREPGSED